MAAFAKANWPTHYLAMTTVTGPSEAWFLTGYPSFAAWEKDRNDTDKNKALTADLDRLIEKDGELLTNARSLVAILREDSERGCGPSRSRRCGTSACSRSGCAPDTRTTSRTP